MYVSRGRSWRCTVLGLAAMLALVVLPGCGGGSDGTGQVVVPPAATGIQLNNNPTGNPNSPDGDFMVVEVWGMPPGAFTTFYPTTPPGQSYYVATGVGVFGIGVMYGSTTVPSNCIPNCLAVPVAQDQVVIIEVYY